MEFYDCQRHQTWHLEEEEDRTCMSHCCMYSFTSCSHCIHATAVSRVHLLWLPQVLTEKTHWIVSQSVSLQQPYNALETVFVLLAWMPDAWCCPDISFWRHCTVSAFHYQTPTVPGMPSCQLGFPVLMLLLVFLFTCWSVFLLLSASPWAVLF